MLDLSCINQSLWIYIINIIYHVIWLHVWPNNKNIENIIVLSRSNYWILCKTLFIVCSGMATGGMGAECHADSEKIAKNREKEGEIRKIGEKKKKNREEKAKVGKVLSLRSFWQIGLATLLIVWLRFGTQWHSCHDVEKLEESVLCVCWGVCGVGRVCVWWGVWGKCVWGGDACVGVGCVVRFFVCFVLNLNLHWGPCCSKLLQLFFIAPPLHILH